MPLGRPREFDKDKALDRAMYVFWQKGYEGASLAELTKAMGINRPSMYAAFGNKEQLFLLALDRYAEGPAGFVMLALQAPTARAVAEGLLRGSLELFMTPKNPRGCLVVSGALASGSDADPVRKELCARRAASFTLLRERFERAKREGDLPANADPSALASYITAVNLGMAVIAAGGAKRAELERIVETALLVIDDAPVRKSGPSMGSKVPTPRR